MKTLQREKIANHLKDLANIISQDAASDSAQPRATNGAVDDMSDGSLRPKLPQRVNSKVSKYRVDPRPSDTLLQQSVRQPQQQLKLPAQTSQGISSVEVESQLPIDPAKQQKVKKIVEDKKAKSSLKDKLDLISKQLLEKRLQESKVCTSNLPLETSADSETLPNSAEVDATNSPSRVRNRKQVTPKAKRKASTNDNLIDTCND